MTRKKREHEPINVMTDNLNRIHTLYVDKSRHKVNDIIRLRDGLSLQTALYKIVRISKSNHIFSQTKIEIEPLIQGYYYGKLKEKIENEIKIKEKA